MVCVHCGGQTAVVNSRHQKRPNQVWRRRRCETCGAVFTTTESVDYGAVWRVRGPKGRLEPFSSDKLVLSLLRSLEHRKTALRDAVGLSQTVIARLRPLFKDGVADASAITKAAQVALNRFDKAASVHYAAHHRG